jgi:asparagine synthase (glutamine-hydrolysing)
MHPSNSFVAPRRYVHFDKEGGCLYDGIGADATGTVTAHDAKSLYQAWERLPDLLEGQFTVIRVATRPATLELMTDPIGMKQVYTRQLDEGWLVSNSVNLLHRIRPDCALDKTALSVFITSAWIVGDNTFRENISVVPGGQLWRWTELSSTPRQSAYYSRKHLLSCNLDDADLTLTANTLATICADVARRFGPLQCPLTAGRDSRLLAALLAHGDVSASYYTDGLPDSTDVITGRELARVGDLPYSNVPKSLSAINEKWDELSRVFIQQTDGMVSLWQIADVFEPAPIDRLQARIWGAGGEIARGNYYEPKTFLKRTTVHDAVRALQNRLVGTGGRLATPAARIVTGRLVAEFAHAAADDGFSPFDSLDLFFVEQITRRASGCDIRKVEATYDLLAPLCTRPFIEATFATPARERFSEPIHRTLIPSLAPHLERVAYDCGRWRPKSATLNGLHWYLRTAKIRLFGERSRKRRAFDQSHWIEARREWIRSFCLDQETSSIWDVADKQKFDTVMSDSTTVKARFEYKADICQVLTAFCYEAIDGR